MVEFLRFGSSIPGTYWGCCAVDIIQNFNFDPDMKSSIQLVDGDGGSPITPGGKQAFVGPTYLDIFKARLRFGTFDSRDMPNHAFLAIITDGQLQGAYGKKWLAILKEHGFEFIRTQCNSVYTGQAVSNNPPTGVGSARNYIFGLFRNIGAEGSVDPFTPPKEWTNLPSVKPEAWQAVSDVQFADTGPMLLAKEQFEADKKIWNALGKAKLMTEEEVVAAGAPVILAGKRSQFPQQEKSQRHPDKAETAAKQASAFPDMEILPIS